ncbi:MAG: hypothetical protein J6Z23_01975 [Lachnospiraceae bacterium]|nr:hypothetical protein [Lachnospiraceae bacterium]
MRYWYLIGVGMALAVALKAAETKRAMRLSVALKAAASLTFVLFGLLSAGFDFGTPVKAWILVGLALGAVGDIVLNVRHLAGESMVLFYIGGGAFLAGHICYLVAIAPMAAAELPAVIGAALVLAVLDMLVIYSRVTAGKMFKNASFVYLSAVAFVVCAAGCAMLLDPGHTGKTLLFAGAVPFFISDSLLCVQMCMGQKADEEGRGRAFEDSPTNLVLGWTLMLLYYAGQLMIAGALQWFR